MSPDKSMRSRGAFLLDSTVIIDYLRGRAQAVERVKMLHAGGASLGCCPINLIEVFAGMRDEEAARTIEFLDSLEFYELDKEAAKTAGGSLRQFRVEGITLSLSDVSIAGIAIVNDLVLLTDNAKHYPQAELRIEAI